MLSLLIGLDAKMRQYEQGERFIAEVERSGGRELMSRVWEGPELLPSLAEIRSPSEWIDRARSRVRASPAVAGIEAGPVWVVTSRRIGRPPTRSALVVMAAAAGA